MSSVDLNRFLFSSTVAAMLKTTLTSNSDCVYVMQ